MSRKLREEHLRLRDPKEARKYINEFDFYPCDRPQYIILDLDRQVELIPDRMSDSDVCLAALILLRDIEIPRIMNQKAYENWNQ